MWPDAKMAEAEWRFTANTRTRLQAGSSPTIGMSRVHNTRTFLSNYRYVTCSQYTHVLVKISVCHVILHARCQTIGMSRDYSTRTLSDSVCHVTTVHAVLVKLSVCHVMTVHARCQTIGMSRDHIESPP